MEHIRELGLFDQASGFSAHENSTLVATIRPTPLCLNLFAKTEGFMGDPYDFYEIASPTPGADSDLAAGDGSMNIPQAHNGASIF